jgi:hypothetical protein
LFTSLQLWFTTEPPRPQEIALKWMGNRAEEHTANIEVKFLEPLQPLIRQQAIVIEGPNIGEICTVLKRKRDKIPKAVTVNLKNSNINIEFLKSSLMSYCQ